MCKDLSAFLRDARIWDFVARNSENKIARGGWRNIRKSDELFVQKSFFSDLEEKYPFIKKVTVSNKIGTISNELINYRFDALIKINWGGVKVFS